MAAVSQLINRGIGFNPGSVKYIITLGLSIGTAPAPVTPFRVIPLTGTYTPSKPLSGTYTPSKPLTGN